MPVDLQPLLTTVFAHLTAIALATARPLALVVVMPVFVRLGLTGLIRGGFVVAIALPVVPTLVDSLPDSGASTLRLVVLVFKESLTGLILGLLLSIPFWAAQVAGDLIDLQRQAPEAQLQDPNAVSEASALGTLFLLVITALFVTAGGLRTVTQSLYDSYGIWPILSLLPRLDVSSALAVLGVLEQLLRLGLVLAFPVLLAMFLATLTLMLIARFIPQLNVFDMSMAARNLFFFLVMPLYGTFLVGYFASELGTLHHVLDAMRRILP
ncbi:type III secretion system export apparatus subunit SctT [Bradyrhizobium sp. USDA 4353]